MEQTFESRFLAARRAVIAARFQNLNAMQLEGVLTTQGPLLLLAGAGSGKTTVLINRIANLIAFGEGSDSQEVPDYVTEEDLTYLETYLKTQDPAMQLQAERLCALRPAAPWSILAITFTNKAANELKSDLRLPFQHHPAGRDEQLCRRGHCGQQHDQDIADRHEAGRRGLHPAVLLPQ